ncbi:DUF4360 domain-containing protein [Streptomyces sp. 6N223]|uniref:DUF4360 domain-containing protein n=1 Tax=Streptomyces sp. 6N223 TaxID=3457412 RepID=UPI003FD4D2C3
MLCLSPSASADTTDTPYQAAGVSLVSVNGSGCPAGTVKVGMASGGSTLTIVYSDFLAWAGPGAAPEDIRKNCAIGLQVDAPAGYTYAIRGLDYDGFAHLENGAVGLQQAQYYFQGSTDGTEVEHDFSGPYDGSLSSSDDIPQEDLVWAPCDQTRNLNVNTELRVDPASSGSGAVNMMAMESTDVPGTTLELAWKQCS